VFAAVFDRAMARAEAGRLGRLRSSLVGRARGRALDVGAGIGANLGHLPPTVDSVVVAEPDGAMRARLERRLAGAGRSVPVEVVDAGLPGLGFDDQSFDTILCTLVLCSVAQPAAAIAELRRLLAPDGRLLFLEHVWLPGAAGRVQKVVAPAWQHFAAGCRLDRDTIGALRTAGLVVADCERPSMTGRSAGGLVVMGSAVRGERDAA
jgi:SAM-dependent methyltransferase